MFLIQGKLEISFDSPEDMNRLAYRYVEGLQWVMHYYYSGIAAWGWFYDYHYAPRISGFSLLSIVMFLMLIETNYVDLRNVDKMTFEFELGTPFRPYEQLMGVLPAASMDHIPQAYRVSTLISCACLLTDHMVILGPDVRPKFADSGLLSDGVRAGSEWQEAGLGSDCQDPFHRREAIA